MPPSGRREISWRDYIALRVGGRSIPDVNAEHGMRKLFRHAPTESSAKATSIRRITAEKSAGHIGEMGQESYAARWRSCGAWSTACAG